MKSCKTCAAIIVGCGLIHAQAARGAGFDLFQMGARGDAMGGAVVGSTEDPSALYYNPANMVELQGIETMVGVSLIGPQSKQNLGALGDYNLDEQWFAIPHAYVSWKLDDDWWIGLAEFSRFGLGTRYDENWPGRFNNIETTIKTFSVNPSVTYKINDQVSVAAGVEAMYMDIKLVRMLPPPAAPALMNITGDSWGYGGDFALSWKPTKEIGVGLVYRLPIRQQLDGTGRTTLPGGTVQDAEGTIDLPASTTLGANYRPTERINVSAFATYTEWSSFDALTMSFSPDGAPLPSGSSPKNWRDVWRFGLGGEYKLTQDLALQGGYVYDMDPINSAYADYLVPPGDHHIFSLGLGYTVGTWSINTGYSLLVVANSEFAGRPDEGVFDTKSKDGLAHMVGLSVGKKL